MVDSNLNSRTDITIGEYAIGPSHPPFIIAEMSGNHNQSLARALEIVDAAADAGADAIKLQTYTADTMTLNVDNDDFKITDPNSLWCGETLYELYEKAHTPWEWHAPILERAKEKGILCFSSPFDDTSVDFLETLHVPCYKIASFENTDLCLLEKVAKTGKPVIISTGMATQDEIALSVSTLRENGCKDIILLKCTSAYPAPASDTNLNTIPHMAETFNCQVGLSDHTTGIAVALAAVVLGATVIEKHFTLSRAEGGVDADFSLEPHELRALVDDSKRAWVATGKVTYESGDSETKSKQFRRSLYFTKQMGAGETVTQECVRSIRPGYGLEPRYYYDVVGKTVTTAIQPGTRVSWDLLN